MKMEETLKLIIVTQTFIEDGDFQDMSDTGNYKEIKGVLKK